MERTIYATFTIKPYRTLKKCLKVNNTRDVQRPQIWLIYSRITDAFGLSIYLSLIKSQTRHLRIYNWNFVDTLWAHREVPKSKSPAQEVPKATCSCSSSLHGNRLLKIVGEVYCTILKTTFRLCHSTKGVASNLFYKGNKDMNITLTRCPNIMVLAVSAWWREDGPIVIISEVLAEPDLLNLYEFVQTIYFTKIFMKKVATD